MLKKYKILAFIVLVKKHRKNSIFFQGENQIDLAKQLGISYTSFKKYKTYCIENGILVEYGVHQQFIKLTKAIELLKLDVNKYHKFFSWKHYTSLTLKNIYEEIVQELLLVKFKQQQFRIDKKQKELSKVQQVENSKRTDPRKVKPLLKKYGSIEKAKSSISKNFTNSIVSGKNHVASIVGCSPATGKNLLKKLHNKNVITRTIVFEKLNYEYNTYSFDMIKATNKQWTIVPSTKNQCFYLSKGSLISLKGRTAEGQ